MNENNRNNIGKNILPNKTVYRIVRLENLIDDIDNEVITFSHPTAFEDVKEYKELDAYFVQCWSKTSESPMMWDIYSKDRLGIMIKFNVEQFNNFNLLNDNTFKPFLFNNYWRDIKYDYEEFEKNNNNEKLEYLFHKRKPYEYENECRWVIDLNSNNFMPITKTVNNKTIIYPEIITNYNSGKYIRLIKIPFEKQFWSKLISEIIIDPRANDDYFEYVYDKLSIRIEANIKRSTFDGRSEKIAINNKSKFRRLYYFSKMIKLDFLKNELNPIKNDEDIKMWLFIEHYKAIYSNTVSNDFINNNYDFINRIINKIFNRDDFIDKFHIISYLILNIMKNINFVGDFINENYKNYFVNIHSEFLLIILNFSYDLLIEGQYISENDKNQIKHNKELINENKYKIEEIIKFMLDNKYLNFQYINAWKTLYINNIQNELYEITYNIVALGIYKNPMAKIYSISIHLYNYLNFIIESYSEAKSNSSNN